MKLKRLGLTLIVTCLMAAWNSAPSQAAPMGSTIVKLKRWLGEMKRRRDVVVTVYKVGGRPSRKVWETYAKGLPQEIRDFYRAFDGLHVEWEFTNSPLSGGHLQIPPLGPHNAFKTGVDVDFGPNAQGMVLDDLQPEVKVYLRRRDGSFDVVMGHSGGPVWAMRTLSAAPLGWRDYLRMGLPTGFVDHFWDDDGSDKADAIAVEKRWRSRPAKVPRFRVGQRAVADALDANSLHTHNRGTIERFAKAGKPGARGPDYALLALDQGSKVWVPKSRLLVAPKDLYETLRSRLAGGTARALETMSVRHFHHLGGQVSGWDGKWRGGTLKPEVGWVRVAGLLNAAPFPKGIAAAVKLLERWEFDVDCHVPVRDGPRAPKTYALPWATCDFVRSQLTSGMIAHVALQAPGPQTLAALTPHLRRLPKRFNGLIGTLADIALAGAPKIRRGVLEVSAMPHQSAMLGLDPQYPTIFIHRY